MKSGEYFELQQLRSFSKATNDSPRFPLEHDKRREILAARGNVKISKIGLTINKHETAARGLDSLVAQLAVQCLAGFPRSFIGKLSIKWFQRGTIFVERCFPDFHLQRWVEEVFPRIKKTKNAKNCDEFSANVYFAPFPHRRMEKKAKNYF